MFCWRIYNKGSTALLSRTGKRAENRARINFYGGSCDRKAVSNVMDQACMKSERKIRDERERVASEGRVEALNVVLSVTEDG